MKKDEPENEHNDRLDRVRLEGRTFWVHDVL
jgi:hypothetical protein